MRAALLLLALGGCAIYEGDGDDGGRSCSGAAPSGCDASDRGICGTSGNNADPSAEPDQVLGQGRLRNGYHDEN